MRICAFSPWPAPTTVFFTTLGAYSATVSPALRRHQHGDAARLPELQGCRRVGVDEGRFHRRLVRRDIARSPRSARHGSPAAARRARHVARFQRTAGDMDQPVAVGLDQAPAGAAEPRIDAENANRMAGHGPVDSPASAPRLARFAARSIRLSGPFPIVTMDSMP